MQNHRIGKPYKCYWGFRYIPYHSIPFHIWSIYIYIIWSISTMDMVRKFKIVGGRLLSTYHWFCQFGMKCVHTILWVGYRSFQSFISQGKETKVMIEFKNMTNFCGLAIYSEKNELLFYLFCFLIRSIISNWLDCTCRDTENIKGVNNDWYIW